MHTTQAVTLIMQAGSAGAIVAPLMVVLAGGDGCVLQKNEGSNCSMKLPTVTPCIHAPAVTAAIRVGVGVAVPRGCCTAWLLDCVGGHVFIC